MGNFREKPHLQKHTVVGKHEYINFACCSMCGWRQFMEDAHLMQYQLLEDQFMSLFAIFDGHGGPEISNFAKSHFLNCLLENNNMATKNYQKALSQVFLHLDDLMQAKTGQKELRKILEDNSKNKNAILYQGQCVAGSTANVVLLTKQYIYCANLGDSRSIAILKQSKVHKPKFIQLSHDHKPDLQIQKRRIIKAGGSIQDGRINNNLNLTRALGDFNYKKNKNLNPQQQIIIAVPQIVKIPRKDVNYIFMGCDGVWETKTPEKMVKWVHKKLQENKIDLGKTLQGLLDEEVSKSAQSEDGKDNMTSILIQIKI